MQILGTQSPFCCELNAGPSYLLIYKGTKILIDCGSGSHRFFDMDNLSDLNIFISHFHRDHYNDIFNYQYAALVLNSKKRLKNPINIFLPTYPSDIYKDIKSELFDGVKYFDINENKKININDIEVEFCKVIHSDNVDTYAMRFTLGKKIIVYSADLSFASKDKIVKFASNADLFLCESSLLSSNGFPEICNHLTAKQAGILARDAKVKKLVLTHFWPETNINDYKKEAREVFKNTFLAKEKNLYII